MSRSFSVCLFLPCFVSVLCRLVSLFLFYDVTFRYVSCFRHCASFVCYLTLPVSSCYFPFCGLPFRYVPLFSICPMICRFVLLFRVSFHYVSFCLSFPFIFVVHLAFSLYLAHSRFVSLFLVSSPSYVVSWAFSFCVSLSRYVPFLLVLFRVLLSLSLFHCTLLCVFVLSFCPVLFISISLHYVALRFVVSSLCLDLSHVLRSLSAILFFLASSRSFSFCLMLSCYFWLCCVCSSFASQCRFCVC